MEQNVKAPVPVQSWKVPAAAVALALVTLAIGARAWNCASARSCTSGQATICSPCCETPSCARAVDVVKETSARSDAPVDAGSMPSPAARPTAASRIGATHEGVSHPPPKMADRLALLSFLLI